MAEKQQLETQEVLKSIALKRKNPINTDTGISECFHKVSTSMYVSLAPMFSQKPVAGVKSQHLDPLVMRYFAPAGGVVLSHYNLKLYKRGGDPEAQTMGKFLTESPFTFMWISTDLLVWKPQAGDKVEGRVNMQTPSHIGLLIHDTFNATIKYAHIPEDWFFTPFSDEEQEQQQEQGGDGKKSKMRQSMGYWSDAAGNRVGGKLEFAIRSVNTGKLVYLNGSLVEDGVGGTVARGEPSRKKIKFADDEEVAEGEEVAESAGDEAADKKDESTESEKAADPKNDDEEDGKVVYDDSDSDEDSD